MEVLNFGGTVSVQEYMGLQQYALGKLMFRLSESGRHYEEGVFYESHFQE
ncbi:MAG: hypothetical protein ACLSB9_38580 [Hydrogeniiclostridium mannosilyticum]